MKKIVSLFLALVICFMLIPCAFAAEIVSASDKFTDVPANAWYLNELNYALANGYISGTSATTFSPSANITRGQFVTILGRMLNAPTTGGSTRFTDVDATSWYAPYVSWAAANGYVNGTSSTTFSPDALITVEQMGVIISNYINKSGVGLSGNTASAAYKDASSISSWAVSSMDLMRQYGLLVTDVAGNVNPHKPVNRAEGTVSLVRLAKSTGLGTEPVIEDAPAPTGQITYASLIKDDPQLITSHAPDDMAAIDNNIRYMLKNDICAIRLSDKDISMACVADGYVQVLNRYPEFGYNAVYDLSGNDWKNGALEGWDMICIYNAFYSDGTIPSQPEDNSRTDDAEFYRYRNAALEKAIKVHDELWASGTIKNTMTQKEKARVYYDWLVKNCDYDWDAYKSGSMGLATLSHGALIEGKAVCQGYTAAYNLLLKLEGIDCSTEETFDHIWTTATLDGVLYHIDATWGDMNNVPADRYFCMTPEASWARFK